EARAPIDLVALASRFPLDEVVHAELCARMAMHLGGGTELRPEPDRLTEDEGGPLSPLLRATDLVTRIFCVGEAFSVPMLRGTWRSSRHPLVKAVLGRIVKDEAAHGAFGWSFLDWALPALSPGDIEHLGRAADHAVSMIRELIATIAQRPPEA